ncbi:hypothetical protein DHEL01_v202756 [Diaporthe helianthi]|uniref:Zn(2)-C6 fungal-type domain-containing protein n=1 Tax=Diaporthe helianthi TaxID=158607 RepID=A0A2P5I8N9_DIAHE|nr:hypothetical protein DHEL01_v202756 [Diaporthe helianthi]
MDENISRSAFSSHTHSVRSQSAAVMAPAGTKIHRLGLGRLVVEGRLQAIVRVATLTLKDENPEKLIVQVHVDGHTLAQWDLVMLRERNLLAEKFFSLTDQKMLQLTLPLFEPGGQRVATMKTIQLFILTIKDFRTAVEYLSNAGMQQYHINEVLQDLRGPDFLPPRPSTINRPPPAPLTGRPMRPQSQNSIHPPVNYSPLQTSADGLHHKNTATGLIRLCVPPAVGALSSLQISAFPAGCSAWVLVGIVWARGVQSMINGPILTPWVGIRLHVQWYLTLGHLHHQIPELGQSSATYPMGLTANTLLYNLQAGQVRPYPQKTAVASKQPDDTHNRPIATPRRPASSAGSSKIATATGTANSSKPRTSKKRPETSLGIRRKRKAPSVDVGVSAAVLPIADKSSASERATRSCMGCRNKKRKCDRSKPACGPCLKDKRPCTYPIIREEAAASHSPKTACNRPGPDADSHPMILRGHAIASPPILSDTSAQNNHSTAFRDIGCQAQEIVHDSRDVEMKDVGTDPSNLHTDACIETERCDDLWVPFSQCTQLVLWASDEYKRKVQQAVGVLRTTDPSRDDYKEKVAEVALVYAGEFMDAFREKYSQNLER